MIAQLSVRHRFEQNLAMSLLAPRQRREIRRAVMRGTAVRHPELAAPAVEMARKLLQRPKPQPALLPGRRKMVIAFGLAAFALFQLASTHWVGAISCGSFVVIIYADELYLAPMRRKRAASIVANGG